MDTVSNVRDLAHVAELLRANDRYVIVPHVAPDPDAFGAACGLAVMLSRLGKTVKVYTDEVIPHNCEFLSAYFPIGHDLPEPDGWKLIFVDGGEQRREPAPVRAWKTWMNLDHHLENGDFAQWIYVDTKAAASSYIMAQLADPLGVALDEASASCLFTGMLFDTRCGFITDKCTPELYETLGRLVAAGARPDHLNRMLNEQMSMGDFRLYGEALAKLETALDGRIVYTYLTQAMMTETGGTEQAMEMLTLNLPKIAGGEVYLLFKESEGGPVKISLRSKGRLAVNAIAKQFDGGGHKYASGAKVNLPMAEAIAAVVAASEKAVREELGART
ncbi:MAG TPA: bifunctional oligoribonuclease/PAP phosphatase NrnA [Oscillatoriaceae cyanobacterium]